MKREVERWTSRLLDEIDALRECLQRHGPKCSGELRRTFSLLDRYTNFRLEEY